jgi:hypothetical protein
MQVSPPEVTDAFSLPFFLHTLKYLKTPAKEIKKMTCFNRFKLCSGDVSNFFQGFHRFWFGSADAIFLVRKTKLTVLGKGLALDRESWLATASLRGAWGTWRGNARRAGQAGQQKALRLSASLAGT